jgi:ribosomal protein S19E (S16A)
MKTTEASIQSTLKQALETCGYIVGEVNKGRKSRDAVYFQTVGLPDLFVTHPEWPQGEWLGIELKSATGKLRPAQQELHDKGRTVVARSVAEGLEMVGYVERKLDTNTVLADAERRKARVLSMAAQFQEVGK